MKMVERDAIVLPIYNNDIIMFFVSKSYLKQFKGPQQNEILNIRKKLTKLKYILKVPGDIMMNGSAVNEANKNRQPNAKQIAIQR